MAIQAQRCVDARIVVLFVLVPRLASRRLRLAVMAAGTAAVLTYAWWATGLRSFTTGSTLAIVGAGLAAMACGQVLLRPRTRPVLAGSGAIGLVGLLVALAAWQLLAYVQHPRSDHPTLSSLVNPVLDTHPARLLAFVAWLAAGAALARR